MLNVFEMITEESVKQERYNICKQCDEYSENTNLKGLEVKIESCKQCGCLITPKISLASSKCPISKW